MPQHGPGALRRGFSRTGRGKFAGRFQRLPKNCLDTFFDPAPTFIGTCQWIGIKIPALAPSVRSWLALKLYP